MFFKSTAEWPNHFNLVKSQVSPIYIYVSQEIAYPVGEKELESWMGSVTTEDGETIAPHKLAYAEFFLISITGDASKVTIASYRLFICDTCTSNPIRLAVSSSVELNEQLNKNYQVFWIIGATGHAEFVDNALMRLYDCENLHGRSMKQIRNGKTRLQQVEHAYASIWVSIMGN